jgi:2-polyprenyl-6-hydroxyphenyl methylase / 3-demethylubiquinone-9 3-methyltransferase
LALFCRDAGLELQRSQGLSYNPLTRRYALTDNTRVNYMIATRKPVDAA